MHCIDHALNLSDHKPIIFEFTSDCLRLRNISSMTAKSRLLWDKATIQELQNYKDLLDAFLPKNEEHLTCNLNECGNKEHLQQIHKKCDNIVNACLTAGRICIPQSLPKRQHIPYWSERVKPHQDRALFWHSLWIQAGRPTDGWIASIRRSTRKKYHQAIKCIKREENRLRRERMAQYISENNTRDLWCELRKLKPSSTVIASVIDGKSNNDDIADLFRQKYESLFNSVLTLKADIHNISKKLQVKVKNEPTISISVEDVQRAIKKLHRGKSDGSRGFTSDHLLHCSVACISAISSMMNSILSHGYCPTVFLESYIISIPKNNKGSLTTSNNYRGISLCNALTKVLDLIIIDKHHYLLNSSHIQFGFKSNHSTAQCVTVFKEGINHYLNRNTNVYCYFIDATKAFDRVHFGILFNILLSRGIPAIILRLLLHLYTSQKVFVKWQDSISSCFNVQNGVRQGAIISSLLFSLYIDVLISRLKDSGIGCAISNTYYGAFGYADDVALPSPSRKGLQKCCISARNMEMNFMFSSILHKQYVCICVVIKLNQMNTCIYIKINLNGWIVLNILVLSLLLTLRIVQTYLIKEGSSSVVLIT